MAEALPILVSEHDDTPIFQQIAHQVTYLIYSQRLPDEARLPTVRALAAQLEVNPNTVAQAYAELQKAGLVHSQRGRGTFVRNLTAVRHADGWVRHDLLREALSDARRRGRALGFSDADVRAQLLGLQRERPEPCEVAFVSPGPSATKYALALTASLAAADVRVSPVELEAVESGAAAAATLARVYFVITPVTLKAHVETLLAGPDPRHTVLAIALDITDDAIARVAALPIDAAVCVFTSQRYLPIALNILHSYAAHPFAKVTRVLDNEPRASVAAAFAAADVVVHTFGVRDALDDHAVPHDRRLELEFQVGHASLRRLRDVLGARPPARVPAEVG